MEIDILGLLPIEISLKILEYLEACDLARCCCVSRGWRRIANEDSLWKRLCHKNVFMEPVTNRKDGHSERRGQLDRMCDWMYTYMNNIHYANNWRENKCTQHQYDLQISDRLNLIDSRVYLLHTGGLIRIFDCQFNPPKEMSLDLPMIPLRCHIKASKGFTIAQMCDVVLFYKEAFGKLYFHRGYHNDREAGLQGTDDFQTARKFPQHPKDSLFVIGFLGHFLFLGSSFENTINIYKVDFEKADSTAQHILAYTQRPRYPLRCKIYNDKLFICFRGELAAFDQEGSKIWYLNFPRNASISDFHVIGNIAILVPLSDSMLTFFHTWDMNTGIKLNSVAVDAVAYVFHPKDPIIIHIGVGKKIAMRNIITNRVLWKNVFPEAKEFGVSFSLNFINLKYLSLFINIQRQESTVKQYLYDIESGEKIYCLDHQSQWFGLSNDKVVVQRTGGVNPRWSVSSFVPYYS